MVDGTSLLLVGEGVVEPAVVVGYPLGLNAHERVIEVSRHLAHLEREREL